MNNDTFQWTNELLYEWGVFYMKDLTGKPYDKLIQAFKQSKLVKKEYEVIQIVNSKGGTIYKDRDDISWEKYADLHSFEGFIIKKVKRLSDNEIFSINDVNEYPTGLQETIKEFKVSEETPTMMLFRTDNEIWQNLTIAKKAQPKKERIEVVVEHTSDCRVQSVAYMGNGIPEGKFPAIKAAIERVLNDEDDVAPKETMIETIKRMKAEYVKRQDFDTASDWRQLERLLTNQPPIGDYMQELNLATMQQLKEAEEKAFNAARMINPWVGTRYDTFQDYINHQRDKK